MLHALFFHFMRTVLGAGPSPSLGPHHLRWAWSCLHLPRTCVCVCVGSKCVCANPSRDTVRLVLGRLTCRQTIRVKHTQTHICTHLSQPSCCSKPPHAATKMHNVKKGMWSISNSFWKIHLNWVLVHVLDHLRIGVGFYLINLKLELVLS